MESRVFHVESKQRRHRRHQAMAEGFRQSIPRRTAARGQQEAIATAKCRPLDLYPKAAGIVVYLANRGSGIKLNAQPSRLPSRQSTMVPESSVVGNMRPSASVLRATPRWANQATVSWG